MSNMDSSKSCIPQNHVFLKHILFSLPNSSSFLLKIYPFGEQIQRFNIVSPFIVQFTSKKSESTGNKTDLERLD